MINSISSLVLAGWIAGALVVLAGLFVARMVSLVTDPDAHIQSTSKWLVPGMIVGAALWPLLSVAALVEPLVMLRLARRAAGGPTT